MSKERFVPWKPNPESMTLLSQIVIVLKGYEKMGIRLTLRQLYYQLVSKNIIANTTRSYKNLGNLLSKARLGGYIDWEIIEDRARRPERSAEWDSIKDIVDVAASQFRLPRWESQPEYVELWCEKDALSSVLKPVCDELHVTMMINRGYSSSSAMYEAAKRLLERGKGKKTTVVYLGDFDPSGEDMVRDVAHRLRTFHLGLKFPFDVEKLALTMDQVEQYKCPPNPLKRDGAGNLTDRSATAASRLRWTPCRRSGCRI